MDDNEIRSVIEAILIASAEPVSVAELATALDVPEGDVDASVTAIEKSIGEAIGGFMLERVAGGLRLATRPEFDAQVRKFFSRKRDTRMSLAALETLAIIAYRQPVSGPEVSDLRGVNSSAVLRTLLERRMIRIAGRKNVVGSPFLYRTTKEFLLHFGLERIQDLPKIEEFGELLGEQVQDDLGFGDLEQEPGRSDAEESSPEGTSEEPGSESADGEEREEFAGSMESDFRGDEDEEVPLEMSGSDEGMTEIGSPGEGTAETGRMEGDS
jgi:segregation and condensation protein B